MSSLPPTSYDTLIRQLGDLPLWVKQVLSAQLRHELEATLSKATLDAFGPEHTLQLWVPEPTHLGLQELEKPTGKYDKNVLRLLHLTRYKKEVVSITVMNNWTLEECSRYLDTAIESQLIGPPRSLVIVSTVYYILGRIRLGEYLVKIGRLTVEQLDQALHTQRAIEEAMGERTGIANVLINLGYIRKEDSEAILFLKEESKRGFQWASTESQTQWTTSQAQQASDAVQQLKVQLQRAIQRIRELETMNAQLQSRQ